MSANKKQASTAKRFMLHGFVTTLQNAVVVFDFVPFLLLLLLLLLLLPLSRLSLSLSLSSPLSLSLSLCLNI